jgi:hypothetical protein
LTKGEGHDGEPPTRTYADWYGRWFTDHTVMDANDRFVKREDVYE